ncbi:MAG: glucan 1,4-alpha-glucosidase, partial [Vicinamibacterales bacterium]
TGVGRAWPLLCGERAHYEIAAGRLPAAEDLARAVEAFAGPSGLLPEQVWDAPDIPERELIAGKATGSARPLAWAHAEYLKLRRSLRDGRVFDRPGQPWQRYVVERRIDSPYVSWRFNNKIRAMRAGRTLRIELLAPARVRWTTADWRPAQDVATTDTGLGVHIVDLATRDLPAGGHVDFTFCWLDGERWEGVDFRVGVNTPSVPGPA